jgi:hypothetical protein
VKKSKKATPSQRSGAESAECDCGKVRTHRPAEAAILRNASSGGQKPGRPDDRDGARGSNDLNQPPTKGDREQAVRALEALVGLVAELNLAFGAQDSQEAKRPVAARQLRYVFAMRAIGTFLKGIGEAHLQLRFFELAEALHGLSKGYHHRLFEIDESAKRKPAKPRHPLELRRGRRPDGPNLWRLRANLCIGIRWLVASGKDLRTAIDDTIEVHNKSLVKLKRPGTKYLAKAIEAWLTDFENPTPSDDQVAVAMFQEGIAELEALRPHMAQSELQGMAKRLIEGTALRASELL